MTTINLIPYDFAALRAMAGATAYPPLPTEPGEQQAPLAFAVADGRSQPKPSQQPKPGYEPLPTETDTRENKPGQSK